jgi:hypothetical protein
LSEKKRHFNALWLAHMSRFLQELNGSIADHSVFNTLGHLKISIVSFTWKFIFSFKLLAQVRVA